MIHSVVACVCVLCPQGAESFKYLSGCVTIPHVNDSDGFRDTVTAFEALGVSPKHQADIFQLLAAILHLGNITFAGVCVCV